MNIQQIVYLDQGPISHLRRSQSGSTLFRAAIERLDSWAITFSDTHVREILRSDRPLEFIEALEGIGAYYLPPVTNLPKIEIRSTALKANIVREVIPEEIDFTLKSHLANEKILRLLAALHMGAGFLDIENEREEILHSIDGYIEAFRQEMHIICENEFDPSEIVEMVRSQFEPIKNEINDLSISQLDTEARNFHREFKKQKPRSQAELDQIPDDEIAEYLFSKLPDSVGIDSFYPREFGRAEIEAGSISSFAFLLFSLGVAAFERPKKGGQSRYLERFISQFRDCEHIENASRCHVFLTGDSRAARLARATYSYAGLPTEVLKLEVAK
ncbi:hypothetical protein [Ruegeria profundi]|uniref:Uncharacterized protein n=1 Tax=Ruegeria profundi TaxID=1685378 RepID=A0A0X3TLR8_9RHOB|nr:hypothetical protein [Ruegeria profundi]KUJ76725.1 hypothetical protein AVO44_19335 [Ruegeria profundi]